MNQGKLEVIKQEMGRVNIDILGIGELKWTGMWGFNSNDRYIYYCGQESLKRNGIALIINTRVQNAILGCNHKNNRMISVHFQGKPFIITVIQVYAPTTNAEEAEVEWFYEDLKTTTTTKKQCWRGCGEPRKHIKKQRHHFANEGPSGQSYFPVVMYGCEVWVLKN